MCTNRCWFFISFDFCLFIECIIFACVFTKLQYFVIKKKKNTISTAPVFNLEAVAGQAAKRALDDILGEEEAMDNGSQHGENGIMMTDDVYDQLYFDDVVNDELSTVKSRAVQQQFQTSPIEQGKLAFLEGELS